MRTFASSTNAETIHVFSIDSNQLSACCQRFPLQPFCGKRSKSINQSNGIVLLVCFNSSHPKGQGRPGDCSQLCSENCAANFFLVWPLIKRKTPKKTNPLSRSQTVVYTLFFLLFVHHHWSAFTATPIEFRPDGNRIALSPSAAAALTRSTMASTWSPQARRQ